jgi:hypothetical protein
MTIQDELAEGLDATIEGIVDIQEDSPLDVSGAVITVTDDGSLDVNSLPEPLDVSGATITVTDDGSLDVNSLPEPLDVSGATVNIQEDSALDVSATTVPTEQQTPISVEDSSGNNIDPSLATDYPDIQVSGEDIIANGDLVIGPAPVARSSGVTIAANSTDGNPFSVSVDWLDGSGNIYQEESATNIEFSSTTQDYSRLVRKAPQVQVTVTDDSGATQNNINIHVDTQR